MIAALQEWLAAWLIDDIFEYFVMKNLTADDFLQRSDYPWTAEHMMKATGGTWMAPPDRNWTASGVCCFAPAFKKGNIVCVKAKEGERGFSLGRLKNIPFSPSGLITSEPEEVESFGKPVLKVRNVDDAILSLGEYARSQMSGKVLAITGSAGKTTTVSMLEKGLTAWGMVTKTSHNSNLPHGVSWSLASMPWDASNVVLELGVGRIGQSSIIARPDMAIFTNIIPSHIGKRKTTKDIAEAKIAIFQGIKPGGIVVLNRDMLEWRIVYDAAVSKNLKVAHYGVSQGCEFRLMDYDPEKHLVTAMVKGREIKYKLGASGEHMAMNSLAVLASISALGHEIEPALIELEGFSAEAGRGEELDIIFNDKNLQVIDDSYNANPGSMKAAIANIGAKREASRRILVLGEMAELGSLKKEYHTKLAPLINDSGIDKVYVTGSLYSDFWKEIHSPLKGKMASSLDALKDILIKDLEDGDAILLKGSNNTNIHRLVAWLKTEGSVVTRQDKVS